MNTPRTLLAIALGAFAFAPAYAQGGSITLRVDSGSAMASQGGDFTSAGSGTVLASGDRVMLTDNSRATLVYGNGCTQTLSAAGVYSVPAVCAAGANSTSTAGVDWQGAGLIAGGTVAIAAGLASMEDVLQPPPPPVSR